MRSCVFAIWVLWAPALAAAVPAGEIVSVVGKGEYLPAGKRDWVAAKAPQPLEGGSFVRTVASDSKMAVLLADRTQFSLQGVASAQVKDPAEASNGKSIVDMVKGTGRFQSKTPAKGFAVGTPTGLAAIRGTEWVIEVDEGLSVVTVVEGEVVVSNALGQVSVLPNEQAVLERDKAPVKRRVQNARERVQWVSAFTVETARYPELRSLGSGPEGQSLGGIARNIDGGALAEARASAKAHAAQTALTLATGHFLAADLALYFGDVEEALALLSQAAARFPTEPRTDALVAWAALFGDRFDLARQAAARALERASGTLESQLAAGDVARLDGRYHDAQAAFRRATAIAPADWRGWHGLARVEGERGNVERARRAFGEALAQGKRALVLGDRGALEAAAGELRASRATLGEALALQADDYTSWAALGYARLRSGDAAGALDALARSTLIEPRYAKAHLLIAVAYWQQGLREAAFASLRRAAEADPRDPLPYQYAAMMRADLLQPGLAVEQAREALARTAYAKSLDAIAGSTRGVANLGAALAQFGLESWALKNAQDSYDPFWSGSHFFLADRYPSKFARNAELFQGFLSDPLALGAPNRFQTLIESPGAYATAALRGAAAEGTRFTEPGLTANGLFADGRLATLVEAARFRQWQTREDTEESATSYTVGIGARPRHDVGVFLYANRLTPDVRTGTDDPRSNYSLLGGVARRIDAGMGWRESADRFLWVKAGASDEDSRLRQNTATAFGPTQTVFVRASDFTTQPQRRDAQARALQRLAGGHELSAAIEGATWHSVDFLARDAFPHAAGTPGSIESVRQDIRDRSRTAVLAGRTQWGLAAVEGQLDWTGYEKTNDIVVRRDFAGQLVPLTDNHTRDGVNGRAGAAIRVSPEATFRVAHQRWLRPASIGTLTASATAGVMLDDRFVLPGGKLDRSRGQLEWQAGKAALLTVFAERQLIDNLYSPLIGTLNNRPDSSNLERLRSRSFTNLASLGELEGFPDLSRGKLREAGASVNVLVSAKLSLYAEAAHASSENTLAHPGKMFPYLPERRAALGATLYPGGRWAIGARAIYRSERFRDEANRVEARLPAEWDGTAQAYWETTDKRWSLELLVSRIGAKSASESIAAAVTLRF